MDQSNCSICDSKF